MEIFNNRKFAFPAIASLLLLSCSMPGWVPFFGEDEDDGDGACYVYLEPDLQACLTPSTREECAYGYGGEYRNSCPSNAVLKCPQYKATVYVYYYGAYAQSISCDE